MVAEQKKQQLADKVEEVIQSTDFGNELEANDPYIYEEIVREALEKKNLPDFIEPKDIENKLVLTNKQTPESWAEILTKAHFYNEEEVESAIKNEDEIINAMLLEIEGNFDAEVEINEELEEVLQRKPDVKTLSDALENAYDEQEFVEQLKEEEGELLDEKVKEELQEKGFPSNVNKNTDGLEYTVHVTIKQSFDDFAERYLEDAREEQNVRLYAAQNVNEILKKEKAYDLEVELESDAEDF